jgi:formylglycine-generating enzyme required for sulfatase activity
LPFEAEWEFAARAGTNSVFSFGDEVAELAKYAWYAMNSEKNYATQVGRKLPNGFGLYDMHGNASEWVQNCITENYSNQNDALNPQENCSARVVRGGSWAVQAPSLRSANRSSYSQTGGLSSISFRVARDN